MMKERESEPILLRQQPVTTPVSLQQSPVRGFKGNGKQGSKLPLR